MNARRRHIAVCALAVGLLDAACVRPGDDRARQDERVGSARIEGLEVAVRDGLAAVRGLSPERIHLWAGAPSFEVRIRTSRPETSLELFVENCMPHAALTDTDGDTQITALTRDVATECAWQLELQREATTVRAEALANDRSGFVDFAVLSDVQDAIDRVQDIYRRMNEEPELDFVLSTGDLTSQGGDDELARFQFELKTLKVPLFATLGNHELGSDPPGFHRFFGRGSSSFALLGARFTLLDAANATLEPIVYGWLDEWLELGKNQIHVVAMHYAPLDPVGVRNGAFASRSEAGKLLGKLAGGSVDLTLYGHIHSFYSFQNAGIPAFISGGGGAIPERFDGIGRHFLMIRADTRRETLSVRLVRVDGG